MSGLKLLGYSIVLIIATADLAFVAGAWWATARKYPPPQSDGRLDRMLNEPLGGRKIDKRI